jgi:hypothetical protein
VGPEGSEALFIVCADGAGSALRSEEGSRWACNELILAIQDNVARSGTDAVDAAMLADAIHVARERLLQNAADMGCSPREFASTLIAVAVTPRQVLVAQIGDGVVVVGAGESLQVAIAVEQEMLNVTDFLVDSNAMDNLRQWSAPAAGIDSIAVSTDGLVPVLVDQRRNEPHPPMFSMFFEAMKSAADETEISERLLAFIQSERVCQRTDDDKTIVLAHRRNDG